MQNGWLPHAAPTVLRGFSHPLPSPKERKGPPHKAVGRAGGTRHAKSYGLAIEACAKSYDLRSKNARHSYSPSPPTAAFALQNGWLPHVAPAVLRGFSHLLPPPKERKSPPHKAVGLFFGRGRRTRTHDTQFWRLVFYRLNYTPMVVISTTAVL